MQSVQIADATQGGIGLTEALRMPHSQRQATMDILTKIREHQLSEMERKSKGR